VLLSKRSRRSCATETGITGTNGRQLAVLWVSILAAALVLLFSPYLTAGTSHPILYRPLLSPPDLVSKDAPGLMGLAAGLNGDVSTPVDAVVLLAQLGIVGLFMLGFMLTLREKQSRSSKVT